MIECNLPNRKMRYIGETEQNYFDKLCEDIGYIRCKKTDKATGRHFNQTGHSLANMRALILEKVKSPDLQYRKRETYHIRQFNAFDCGPNLKP